MDCCGGMDGGMMGGMWIWGLLWFGLIAAGIILVVWAIVRGTSRQVVVPEGNDHALATLRERFASGEINEEEYQQRRSVLTDKVVDH